MGIGLWLVALKPKRLTLSEKVKQWHGRVEMLSWQPLGQNFFFFFVPRALKAGKKITGLGLT